MKQITKLENLYQIKYGKTPKIAIAAGQDPDTIRAVNKAVQKNICDAILVGNQNSIKESAKQENIDLSPFTIINKNSPLDAAKEAVRLVHKNEADMLMKGLIKTSTFMKLILDKENGLLPQNGLLSHIALMEIPTYSKLLIISDAAIIPSPDMEQKVQILNYATEIAHAIGNKNPKAALISAVETINVKVQSTVDAAVITAMNKRKQIQGVIVDGPLALDVSLSPEQCRIKGLDSPVNGQADILIFPNIETANTFYKSTILLARAKAAAIVVGTSVPVVLPSRADDDDTKFYSIALAAKIAEKKILDCE